MYKKIIGVSALLAGFALVLAPLATATGKDKKNDDPKKVFVCKYVGKPGVNETLQTGGNPISVSTNAIKTWPVAIGGYFADAQGRSLVIAFDTGQAEPVCPGKVVVTTIPPTTVPPTTVVPTTVGAGVTPLPPTKTRTAAVPPVKKTPASATVKKVSRPGSPVAQVKTPPAGGVEGGDGSSAQALAFTGVNLTGVLLGVFLILSGLGLLAGKRLTIVRR